MNDIRLAAERERVFALAAASNGAVEVLSVAPNYRQYEIRLNVAAPVGTSSSYRVDSHHRLMMDLPDDFPANGPICTFGKAIFVPNVYPSGVACIVDNLWVPSQHLDQVICDLVEEIQAVNPNFHSVANQEAGRHLADPVFEQELRRRLGPPVLLIPPESPQTRVATIATIGQPVARAIQRASASGVRSVGVAAAPRIRTTRH